MHISDCPMKMDNKKSIHLCLISCYPPSNGPLSEYSYHLAENLSKERQISKITILADITNGRHEVSCNEKIEVIRCWKLNDIFTPIHILKHIRDVKADVIYFNLVFRHFSSNRLVNFIGLCTPALLKLLNIPVVITLHSIAEVVNLNEVGYKNSITNRIGYRLATKLLLKADMLTVTHLFMANILRKKYAAKNVLHIPHGVFHEPVSNCSFNSKRILLFGKMGPYKNLPLMIESFEELVKDDKQTELVIAGSSHPLHSGFLEAVLEKFRHVPNINVLGYVHEKDIESLFVSSAVVVLPYSISTWSSGVFTLASIYGRPVIASDLPDFRELLEEGAGVILFHNGSKHELASAIKQVLNDKELQQKLCKKNLDWARQNNFKEATVDKLLYVFNMVAK